jgi:hypothetical protein
MNTLKILRYQTRDVLRNRWIPGYALFFMLVTDALFRFGGDGERVILSLMNLVLLLVPAQRRGAGRHVPVQLAGIHRAAPHSRSDAASCSSACSAGWPCR